LSSSFPALLHYGYKYAGFEEALLASTNAGGENVARGATLGALLGAQVGMTGLPPHLITGLADSDEIRRDIERFMVAAVDLFRPADRLTKLGGWVKNQRANKRKLDRGEPSKGMTAERAAKLEALGFRWAKAKEAKGVSWDKKNKKWKARVYHQGGKTENLGDFATEEEAKARCDAHWKELGREPDVGTSSSFRGVCRKKSEGKWIKEEAKRKAKAKAKKNAKKKNAKRKSPAITRANEEDDRKAKRKAKARTKKNTKRQRTVAIQTGWHMKAQQAIV
jgi:hypothetical protein